MIARRLPRLLSHTVNSSRRNKLPPKPRHPWRVEGIRNTTRSSPSCGEVLLQIEVNRLDTRFQAAAVRLAAEHKWETRGSCSARHELFRKNDIHLTGTFSQLPDSFIFVRVPEITNRLNGRPLGYHEIVVTVVDGLGCPLERFNRATIHEELATAPLGEGLRSLNELYVLFAVGDFRIDEHVGFHGGFSDTR